MISITFHMELGEELNICKCATHPYRIELYEGPILFGVREGTLKQCRAYIKETVDVGIPISTFKLLHK